jgi:hypothetical protein
LETIAPLILLLIILYLVFTARTKNPNTPQNSHTRDALVETVEEAAESFKGLKHERQIQHAHSLLRSYADNYPVLFGELQGLLWPARSILLTYLMEQTKAEDLSLWLEYEAYTRPPLKIMESSPSNSEDRDCFLGFLLRRYAAEHFALLRPYRSRVPAVQAWFHQKAPLLRQLSGEVSLASREGQLGVEEPND